MTVRTGMSFLVNLLKDLTAAGDEFTDTELQDYLDRTKIQIRDEPLIATPTYVTGGVIYTVYDLPNNLGQWFELPTDDVLNAAFYLTDFIRTPFTFGDGDNQAVFDQNLRRITFNSNTNGAYYYLSVYNYDLYGAAAEVWQTKANNRVPYINIKIDNHSFGLKDEYDHCIDRINYYRARSSRNSNHRFVRYDQGVGYVRSASIRGFMPVDHV